MTVFRDIKNNEYVADTEIKLTEGVNGEKSLTGTIYFGNDVKKNLAKGWTMIFNDEEYAIVTFRYNDTDNTVSFSAVQMFFYTLSVKAFHEEWNGSHPLNEYLNAIFKDTGYSYINETSASAFEKENWGLKDKLTLFNDIINQISAEFEVKGTTVYIKDKIGSDLSTVVRQGFNLSTAEIETDSSSFATYGIGYGVHDDVDDETSPRLSVEYYSPLYDMYKAKFGAIEAEPVDDERYTISDNLLAAVKKKVDNSWSLSITVSLLDLQNAGYPYAMASAGDSITIVDESLGFEDEVRIIKVVSSYNINGERISVDVTCGDLTMAQAQSASSSVATSTITDIINGNSTLPDAWFSEQMQLATNSILDARTELKFTDQGIIAVDKSDHNKMVILNSAGIGVSTDGGQTFRTAITANAIDGQVINIKNLNASNIVAGKVSGKDLSIDLDTGKVQFEHGLIQSTANTFSINVDTGKVLFTHGELKGDGLDINLDTGAVQFTSGYIQGNTSGGVIRLDMDTASLESADEHNAGFLTTEGKMIFYSDFLGQSRREFGRIEPSILAEDENALKISGTNGVTINSVHGTSGADPDFSSASVAIGSDLWNKKGDILVSGTGSIELNSGGNNVLMSGDDIRVGQVGSGKASLLGKEIIVSTALPGGSTSIYSGGALTLSGPKSIHMTGNTTIVGDFGITGTKNAITPTRDGIRATPAYEMAESYFGDIGETLTGYDCRVKVPIDVIFGDIVNTNYKYQVFLQSYSAAHVWVSERHDEYFVIESDQPNASVAWELKARRRGHETERLSIFDGVELESFDEKRDPLANLK